MPSPSSKDRRGFTVIDGDRVENHLDQPYDPNTWFLASNSRSMRNRLRYDSSTSIPPALHAVVMELVNSEETPYRSVNDFVRDWCFKGVLSLTQQLKEKKIDTTQLRAEAAYQAEVRRSEEAQALIEDVEERLREAKTKGDHRLTQIIGEHGRTLLLGLEEPYRSSLAEVLVAYCKKI